MNCLKYLNLHSSRQKLNSMGGFMGEQLDDCTCTQITQNKLGKGSETQSATGFILCILGKCSVKSDPTNSEIKTVAFRSTEPPSDNGNPISRSRRIIGCQQSS